MKIDKEEQQQIIDLMEKYKSMHDEIARVEVSIKDFEKSLKMLHEDKDKVIGGIKGHRELEDKIIKSLIEKYGEGKLDPTTFEWITDKQ